jgi:hypothetical protein
MATKNGGSEVPDFIARLSASIEEITPRRAKEILAVGNRKNRKLNESHVINIERLIARGEWMADSNDMILIDEDGALVNGQHRMEAIARGDIAVWLVVLRGVDRRVVQVIDQGSNRTLAQALEIDGRWADPAGTAMAIKWLYLMINRMERKVPSGSQGTVPQYLALLEDHRAIEYSLAPGLAAAKAFKASGMTKGVFAAYHYAMSTADPDKANEFFSALSTGMGADDDSPAIVLRRAYLDDEVETNAKRMPKWVACASLVKAWEAFRADEQLVDGDLKFVQSGQWAQEVPTVTGVDWLLPDDEDDEDEDN